LFVVMKTVNFVLLVSLLLYAVTITGFTWYRTHGNIPVAHVFKPFVVWSLMVFFLFAALHYPKMKALAWRLFAAFLTYGIGDIVMEWGTIYTPVGMAIFFIGHIVYIRAIPRSAELDSEKKLDDVMQPNTRVMLAWALGFLVFAQTTIAVGLVAYHSGEYLFCMGAEIYAQLFTTALVVGCLNYRRISSMVLTCAGAFIYASSDIIIAFERYVIGYWWMPLAVMSTYWIATLFYAAAFFPVVLKHQPEEEEENKKKAD